MDVGVDDASELPIDEHDRELLRGFHSSSVLYRRLALEWRERGRPYLRRNLAYRRPRGNHLGASRSAQHLETSHPGSSSSRFSHDSSAPTPALLQDAAGQGTPSLGRESPPSLLSSSLPAQHPQRPASPGYSMPSQTASEASLTNRACWWRRAQLGIDLYTLEARVVSLTPLARFNRGNVRHVHSCRSAKVTFTVHTQSPLRSTAHQQPQQDTLSRLHLHGKGTLQSDTQVADSTVFPCGHQDGTPPAANTERGCEPAARVRVSSASGSACLVVTAQVQEAAPDGSSRSVEYASPSVPLSPLLASRKWQDELLHLTLVLTTDEEVLKPPSRLRHRGQGPDHTKKAMRMEFDLFVVEEATTRANNMWWHHSLTNKYMHAPKQGRPKASKQLGPQSVAGPKDAALNAKIPITRDDMAEHHGSGANARSLLNGKETTPAASSLDCKPETYQGRAQAPMSENPEGAPHAIGASPCPRYSVVTPSNSHGRAAAGSARSQKRGRWRSSSFDEDSAPGVFTSANKLSFYGLLAPFRQVVATNAEASCVLILRFRSRQWVLSLTPVLNCPWCGQGSASIYELVLHLSSEHPRFLVSIEVKAMECQVTLTLCETPATHLNAAPLQGQPMPQGDTFVYSVRPGTANMPLRDHWQVHLGMSAEVEPDSQHHLSPEYVLPTFKGSALDLSRFFGKAHRRIVTAERLASLQRPFFHTPFVENRDPCCEDNSEDEVEDDMRHLPPARGVRRAWSSFVAKQPVVTTANMAKLCHKFITMHGSLLKHDRIGFLLHLRTLHSHGLLQSDEAATILRQVPT